MCPYISIYLYYIILNTFNWIDCVRAHIYAQFPGNEDLVHAQHDSEKLQKHWLYGVI